MAFTVEGEDLPRVLANFLQLESTISTAKFFYWSIKKFLVSVVE